MTEKMQENKAKIIKKSVWTPESVREIIGGLYSSENEPRVILKNLAEALNKMDKTKGGQKKEVKKEVNQLIQQALFLTNLDNQILLAETVSKSFKPYAIELTRQIMQEYKCETTSEKALAQVIANAHARVLQYSRALNGVLQLTYVSMENVAYYGLLSKCLDRAQRDFITALTTLKQVKSPGININIRADQALVAQNQQLNISTRTGNQDEKIIS
jgi:hypothetical protein